MAAYTQPFKNIGKADGALVGGKNSSLGEMYNQLAKKGIRIPDGFATTADAYWHFLKENQLQDQLKDLLAKLDKKEFTNLKTIGQQARALITKAKIPEDLRNDIITAYHYLSGKKTLAVAVRSSATAEDLPEASFAGQHDSYLNISGPKEVVKAVHRCYASLFNDRAIKYREDNHFDHNKIALSAGIQKMVHSDLSCSGIGFTLEPESGFRNVVHIAGTWGLGENIVQGNVSPDEFLVFKPALKTGKKAIIQKHLGKKATMMVYTKSNSSAKPITSQATPDKKRDEYVLTEKEIVNIAQWAVIIEDHYGKPMDFEWAKDGKTNRLYIVQARPETVHSRKNPAQVKQYKLNKKGTVLVSGEAVGNKIASGKARILKSPKESDKLQAGEILVTERTTPDWDPILKKAAAIITNTGGRTSHASIIARELGVPAVIGAADATKKIKDGQEITVSCAEGRTGVVYEEQLEWQESAHDLSQVEMPKKTKVMLIVGDPGSAFASSFYPNDGVGLMRIEFVINNAVKIHPMALVNYEELQDKEVKKKINELTHLYKDKTDYFVDKLSQGVATIAAAFYPKDVIVRMSDFKTNEYAGLIGGKQFEPDEENPMLGFRGASRYYHPQYITGFQLECKAMKIVREIMGFENVKLMVPFCRTVAEGKKVIKVMQESGLKQGRNKLEIYMMTEIPSNVLLAEDFAKVFDGFSVGSNDLTQLTLGIDRDSSIVAGLFNENDAAAKAMIGIVIDKAKKAKVKIGLCGQAPSDFPEFAQFLVEHHIDSISFNADPEVILKGIKNIKKAEHIKDKR
jgi:pyruvate,water dikinase